MTGRTVAVLILVVVLAGVFALMWRGWRGRQGRQSDLPAPHGLPGGADADRELGPATAAAEGMYVVTTTAGDWLDRIAVHGLGVRSTATLSVHPSGVLLDRSGAPSIVVPAADLQSVSLTSGMAGKFVERNGLLVLTWRLGPQLVDTGFRTRRAGDQTALLDALLALPGVRRRDNPHGVPDTEPADTQPTDAESTDTEPTDTTHTDPTNGTRGTDA